MPRGGTASTPWASGPAIPRRDIGFALLHGQVVILRPCGNGWAPPAVSSDDWRATWSAVSRSSWPCFSLRGPHCMRPTSSSSITPSAQRFSTLPQSHEWSLLVPHHEASVDLDRLSGHVVGSWSGEE